jgi:hypothetical protein
MAYQDMQQQMPLQNPQHWGVYSYGQPQGGLGIQGVGYGLGQGAYGQFGQPNIGGWGQGGWGGQAGWGQRHLSQQDVGEVVRQLVPLLPVMLAQAQQPMAAFGYGGYNQGPRMLAPQDVNEVVRQILPIVPQIVGLLQGGQWPHQAGYGGAYGGYGGLGQIGQTFYGQQFQPQHPLAQFPYGQQPFGQLGTPPFQSAYGGGQGWGQPQRQLTQQDIGEVVRHLTAAIPQVINNLQAFNQQRAI